MERSLFEIDNEAEYSNLITGMEYHTHKPYASNTFNNNDEIRIPVNQQDTITAPFESYIYVRGKLSAKKADGTSATCKLVNNTIAFLFDSIRYEIAGIEVDRTKNVGIATTIKTLLSTRLEEVNAMYNSGWFGAGKTESRNTFSFCIPLKYLLGFAENYRRIVMNVKQELVLLRAATDNNAIVSTDASTISLTIESISWRMPHITVNDSQKLALLKILNKDTIIHLPFRSMEMLEYPTLPQTNKQSWTVKTSSQLEKPRYIVLAFQTDRKNELSKNMSEFDSCGLSNVKVYLNSQYFPYDNINGDWAILYEMYCRFQNSYYGNDPSPCLDFSTFKTKCPLFVIDCSKQDDTIKSGPIDVRIEFESDENIPDKTSAYCLILHDCHIVYTPLTASVRRLA